LFATILAVSGGGSSGAVGSGINKFDDERRLDSFGEESGELELRKELREDFLARAGDAGARSKLIDEEERRRAEVGLDGEW
jgi:hypothetical protein